jgi:hypothetical protein
MLSTDGVFIFEVPLMSDVHDNAIWLKSSLEHIYYPTVAGLHYVFNEIFGLPLIGHEVSIREYGSVFVGIVTLNRKRHTELEQLHRYLFEGSVLDLVTDEERVVRFLFDTVHAAQTTPATVALLKYVPSAMVTTHLLLRLSQIWHHDTLQRDALTAHALILEQQLSEAAAAYHNQRDWLQTQTENYLTELENWQQIAEERTRWISQLEEARDYYAQQADNWQAATEVAQREIQALTTERDTLARERDTLLNEGLLSRVKRQIKTRRRTKGRTRPLTE